MNCYSVFHRSVGLLAAVVTTLVAALGAQSSAAAGTLRVLSYNAYFFPIDRISEATETDRLRLMPAAIAATGADVVLLQEVWSNDNREALARGMASAGYKGIWHETRSPVPPYFFGNGLQIFAKEPLKFVGEPMSWAFPFADQIRFDKLGRKGILKATIEVPGYGVVDVFSAHTGYMPFLSDTHDFDFSYQGQHGTQMRHILSAISTGPSRLRIIGIDANAAPDVWSASRRAFERDVKSEIYRLLTEEGGLVDALKIAPNGNCPWPCDTVDFRRNRMIDENHYGTPGEDAWPNSRIDYVFLNGKGARVTDFRLAMEEEYIQETRGWFSTEKKSLPLSDHYGVLTTIELTAD